MKRAGVVGGGAWGTALAQVCARAGLETVLWAREHEVVDGVNAAHENALFLPGVTLDSAIRATADFVDLARSDLILAVTPAQHLRSTLQGLAPQLAAGAPVVLCAKGFEQGSLKMMTEVLAEAAPAAAPAVLSGPSFAGEVARGLPTAVTLACPDEELGWKLAQAIATPTFRPYLAQDMVGAEAGGAVKNVLAIACGIVEGRGLGRSAHAALITRGFAEMTRLAVALGAQAETLAGLCGLGDLVLTCSSTSSRNFSLGKALGEGQSATQALAGKTSVAEGAATAPVLAELADKAGVDMPIVEAVRRLLAGEAPARSVVSELLARPLKAEQEGGV